MSKKAVFHTNYPGDVPPHIIDRRAARADSKDYQKSLERKIAVATLLAVAGIAIGKGMVDRAEPDPRLTPINHIEDK